MQHTIYIKEKDEATYSLFQKVCDREGTSTSAKIMLMIYDYMAGHGEGNPQTILDYAGEIMTLPKWKTCRFSGGTRVQGDIYCQPVRRRGYFPGWKMTQACDRCEIYETAKVINDARKMPGL